MTITDRAKKLILGIAKLTGQTPTEVLRGFADLDMFNSQNPQDQATLAALYIDDDFMDDDFNTKESK